MLEFKTLQKEEKIFGGVVMTIFGFVLWVIDVIDAPTHMKAVVSIFPIVGILTVIVILIRGEYYALKGE